MNTWLSKYRTHFDFLAVSARGRRSNKQNGSEQKNKKILTYIGLYQLIDKTIIRIVKNYQENE